MAAGTRRLIERTIEDPEGRMQHVAVNLGESPLSWLHARGLVSERQYLAGDLLRRDWEQAGLGPHVTMHWNAGPLGRTPRGAPRPPEPGVAQLCAKERFDAAVRAAGPGLSDILWRVACAGEGIASAEKALGWPTRAGKLVLTLALDRIAAFYRLR